MSANDVPGANAVNQDVLAMGCWAEHEDGSLIFVSSVEAGTVVYSIFDLNPDLPEPVEYRDAMPERGFKDRFSWKSDDDELWTWHDKTPFPWDRVMQDFPGGTKSVSARHVRTAAERVAASLKLRAEKVRDRQRVKPTPQIPARNLMQRINDAAKEFLR